MFRLRRLQRMEGQTIQKTRKNIEKNDLRANTPHTLVCFEKATNNVQNWSSKMTPLGLKNTHIFLPFGPWGAEKFKRCPQSRQGMPLVLQMVAQRSQKGAKMEPQSSKKLENNVKNNVKMLKQTNQRNKN